MAQLKVISAKSWIKCASCSEQIRTDEKYIQVFNNDKQVRGERYCKGCEKYARMNNTIEDESEDDGESHLRDMETYAAYQAAGCASEYFDDRNAGYC
jgi:MinD superfamily P-loop ATPase